MEVMKTMGSVLDPVALAVPPTLVVTTPTNSVVALVRIMKSMREMGCEPFIGD
jgi:hypothetical protein